MVNAKIKSPPEIVYLDTNIISYYFSNLPEYRIFRDATREWWTKKSKNYYLCSSMAAEYELRSGNYLHQEEALRFMQKLAVFPIHAKIEEIAQYYIDHNLAPKENINQLRGDALHLAVCAFYEVDFLLTWNQRHLANINKLQRLRIMNAQWGFRTPQIVTPMQLL